MKPHLVSVADLSASDIKKIFGIAAKMKKSPQSFGRSLQGHMFGLIFEKPSTRTWISFEAGICSLGGGVIYLGPEDIKLGIREETRDVARVLSRYLSGIVLRTFSHATITEFQQYFKGVIINGLSDFEHPCQALADFFTLTEKFPKNKKPVLSFIGDGNNVLNSLILVAAILGYRLQYATPEKHEPLRDILEKAKSVAGRNEIEIFGTHDPREAVKNTDVVYTDVWVSMGEESMRDSKLKEFEGMQVNSKLLSHANSHALIMHCLPAHRGEEITDEVMESKHSIVFDQAENRLHVQKALLYYLLKSRK